MPVPQEHTFASYLALVRTTSTYLRLDPAARLGLDARFEDVFRACGGARRWIDSAMLVSATRGRK